MVQWVKALVFDTEGVGSNPTLAENLRMNFLFVIKQLVYDVSMQNDDYLGRVSELFSEDDYILYLMQDT